MSRHSHKVISAICRDLTNALSESIERHKVEIERTPVPAAVPPAAMAKAFAMQCIGLNVSDVDAMEAFRVTLEDARLELAAGIGRIVKREHGSSGGEGKA